MKRLGSSILVLVLLLIPYPSHQNPIPLVTVSELYLPSPSAWLLEIERLVPDSLDSWAFKSKVDSVRFKPGLILDSGFTVLNQQDLATPLPLGMVWDEILIYERGMPYPSRLAYGEQASPDIAAPKQGQSICLDDETWSYYLDKTPTLGAPNDTVNACGVLRGTVNTPTGEPVEGVTVEYHGWPSLSTSTDSLGRFEINDLSMRQYLSFYRAGYASVTMTWQMWPESTVAVTVTLDPITETGPRTNQSSVRGFALEPNYPNPFNPSTTIEFLLSHRELVVIDVVSVNGEFITNLASEVYGPGRHTLRWDASSLASGVYFCRMRAGTFSATQKLLLLR